MDVELGRYGIIGDWCSHDSCCPLCRMIAPRLSVDRENIRILHCIPTLGGGGAERQLACLSEQMTKAGASVHIVCHRLGPNFDRVRKCGVKVHKLACRNNHDPLILWRLIQTMREVRPHVVHTWLTQMDVLGGLAAAVTGIPFVISEQSSPAAYPGAWKHAVRLFVGRRAAAIIANSESGKRYWQSAGHFRRVEVIRNGIPVLEIQQSSRVSDDAAKLPSSAEVILWAGRYSIEKDPLTFIKAACHVLEERPTAVALLFGDGPLRCDLLAKLRQFGLQNRVRLEGFTTALWSWMKRANVLVSTSLYEGSPNAVFEAAAVRCPLVLSDIPGHRELLHEGSALFVSPSDVGAVSQGILRALRDPEATRRRADAAYQELSKWTLDSVVGQYFSLYRSAA
jgi:glycosyltransferase involved in cell wall biosynthesis